MPTSPLDSLLRSTGRKNVWLAETLKVHPSLVSRWCHGLIPPAATQKRIAKALRVTVSSLWPKDEA